MFDGRKLYRIEALKDFSNVKKGDKGGFVESEDNLSQKGNCWIYHTAKVFDNAAVCGDALISDNAVVCNNAGNMILQQFMMMQKSTDMQQFMVRQVFIIM